MILPQNGRQKYRPQRKVEKLGIKGGRFLKNKNPGNLLLGRAKLGLQDLIQGRLVDPKKPKRSVLHLPAKNGFITQIPQLIGNT